MNKPVYKRDDGQLWYFIAKWTACQYPIEMRNVKTGHTAWFTRTEFYDQFEEVA